MILVAIYFIVAIVAILGLCRAARDRPRSGEIPASHAANESGE